jgi:hypothetical protein
VLGRWRQQRRWPRSKSSNMQDKRERLITKDTKRASFIVTPLG